MMQQFAQPSDYAEWGAEAGLAIARTAQTHPFAPLATKRQRREAIGAGFKKIAETAADLRNLGASDDEVRLYTETARRAFNAQMGSPLPIQVTIKGESAMPKKTIFTETTPRDDGFVVPDHVTVEVADDAPASEFSRIGRVAGLQCRADFNQTYRGSNADPRLFFSALGSTVESVLRKMKAGGTGDEKVAAWRDAFWEAMAMTEEEWELLSGIRSAGP